MAALLKGNFDLLIDPQEIEASLEFTVNKNGQIWSREKIITLLKQRRIIDSVNPLLLEKAIQQFKQCNHGSHNIVIAKGTAPKPPQHGSIKWQDLSIPESLKNTVDSIVKKAPPPLVYDYKIKKTKSPKKLRKKKGFFLKSKKHRENDYYLREIKEKITVSPEVKRIAYVEKGSLIATFIDPVPGVPGKNIFGMAIPPPAAQKTKLYYSDGISQKDKQCFAEVTGILRIGSNWIDIIPYEATYYRVYASEDGLDCFFDFFPGSGDVEDFSVDEIIRKAHELNFEESDLIPASVIDDIIAQSRHYQKTLKGHSLCVPIEPLIELTVSEDRLKATLSLRKGRGQGKALSLKEISKTIKDASLKNLNLLRIKQDILDFYKGRGRELINYTLTEGAAPAKGENGQLIWEITFEEPENLLAYKNRFEKQDSGAISSLKEFPLSLVESIAKVKRDDKIALLHPPETGYPGQDVYGSKIEGLPGKEAQVKLYENLKMYGHYVIAGQEGFLEKAEKDDGVTLLRVRPSVDAKAFVALSDDKMQAFLSIIPPKGSGKKLSLEKLLEIIEQQGIIHGLNEEEVRKALEKSGKGFPVENMLIASGAVPVHGIGERIRISVLEATGRKVQIRTDGRADYKQQDKITIVKKGDLLAEITPPRVETSDGMDVLGNVIPATQKGGVSYTVGSNARKELQPNGVIKIFANVDGEFVFKKNVINVRKLHLVNRNVGLETGNIKFPGSVYIKGSVQTGFSVVSGENIIIENVVEEALISADGSIIVKKGVKGNGKAILRSKKSIQCLFAENAFILAVEDIHIRNSLLHCNVKCNGRLILGREKGTAMGGHIRVKFGMELINLGSISEVKTKVSFGQDCLVGDQIEVEEKEIKKLGDRVLNCDAQMKTYKQGSSADPEKLKSIREEKLQCLKLMEKHSQRLFLLREKFEEHYPSEVIIKGTVYPGVTIESHGRIYEVKEEKTMTAFIFNPRIGSIEIKPLA